MFRLFRLKQILQRFRFLKDDDTIGGVRVTGRANAVASEFVTHHQSNRKCEGYERGDEWSYNWDRVDCEDCWEKREQAKRWAEYAGWIFGGICFLVILFWMVVFLF